MSDVALAENLRLPLWVYSVLTDTFACYQPTGKKEPLVGRAFELGSHDCAGLVLDYYRDNLALNLEDFRRLFEYVDKGWPDLVNYMFRNSLYAVSAPQDGDILLMTLGRAKQVNHCGIYMSGSRMMHQLMNRRSEIVAYGGYWKRVTTHILRHKTQ